MLCLVLEYDHRLCTLNILSPLNITRYIYEASTLYCTIYYCVYNKINIECLLIVTRINQSS